jgi:hypothetical protein
VSKLLAYTTILDWLVGPDEERAAPVKTNMSWMTIIMGWMGHIEYRICVQTKLLQLYDKYDQNLLELHGDEFLIKTIATLW